MSKIKTGGAHTAPAEPTHVKGINEGNTPGNYDKMAGHNPDGTSTAERSTGIQSKAHEPIAAGMPNLSPA
jgi:hypothetical protein